MGFKSDIQSPSPRIESIFQKNELPSPEEENVCSREISAIEDAIVIIDREIQTLLEEKARLTEYARKYRSILHPIRRLPYEVLLEIFSACVEVRNHRDIMVPERLPSEPVPSLALDEPPWSLGQVCRKWRQTALSCPSLWTYIGIAFPTRYGPAYHRKDAITHSLTIFLSRSGNLPLVVHVDFDCASTGIDEPGLLAICSQSLRWKKLRFTGRTIDNGLHTVFPPLSRLIKSKVPLLHSLFFDFPGFIIPSLSPGPRAIDAFEDAPSLRCVIIRGLTPDPYTSLRIPWDQITGFHRIICLGWRVIYEDIPLELMPEIVEYSDTYFRCLPGSHIIDLSRLQALRISKDETIPCDLNLLQMGERFNDLRIGNEHGGHPIESLVPFLQRWGNTLRCLCLDDQSITSFDDNLTQTLGYLHSLKALALSRGYGKSHAPLIKALTTSTQTHRCPQLQHLALFGGAWDREDVVEMLSSRLLGDQQLRTCGLSTSENIDFTFEEFQARGLRIWHTDSQEWLTYFLPGY